MLAAILAKLLKAMTLLRRLPRNVGLKCRSTPFTLGIRSLLTSKAAVSEGVNTALKSTLILEGLETL
jgi:hypothetical protein